MAGTKGRPGVVNMSTFLQQSSNEDIEIHAVIKRKYY